MYSNWLVLLFQWFCVIIRLELLGELIKTFRCYEAKVEESEKGQQSPGIKSRAPDCAASALPLSYDSDQPSCIAHAGGIECLSYTPGSHSVMCHQGLIAELVYNFLACSYHHPHLYSGWEAGCLSWGGGDLHLHHDPGICYCMARLLLHFLWMLLLCDLHLLVQDCLGVAMPHLLCSVWTLTFRALSQVLVLFRVEQQT